MGGSRRCPGGELFVLIAIFHGILFVFFFIPVIHLIWRPQFFFVFAFFSVLGRRFVLFVLTIVSRHLIVFVFVFTFIGFIAFLGRSFVLILFSIIHGGVFKQLFSILDGCLVIFIVSLI